MLNPHRIASRYLARQAYDEKGRSPDVGWQHGIVEPFIGSSGEGSQVPPARDDQGAQAEVAEYGMMDIPGYEWHNRSEAFHDNPPGEVGIQRVAGVRFDLLREMNTFRTNLRESEEREVRRVTDAVGATLKSVNLNPSRVEISRDRAWFNVEGRVSDESTDVWRSRAEVEKLFEDLFETLPQLRGAAPHWTFSMGGF